MNRDRVESAARHSERGDFDTGLHAAMRFRSASDPIQKILYVADYPLTIRRLRLLMGRRIKFRMPSAFTM
jgi:hypothetical protein